MIFTHGCGKGNADQQAGNQHEFEHIFAVGILFSIFAVFSYCTLSHELCTLQVDFVLWLVGSPQELLL